MSEISAVVFWWFLVQLYGLVTLPLSFRLFSRLTTRGYGVNKALGLLVPNYIFWLLGILGFLRNDSGSIILSLLAALALAWLFYRRSVPAEPTTSEHGASSIGSWLRANWKLILVTELVFTVSFVGWAVYRAYVPRIMTAGGEKFMELAFLNGFERSATLPPLDPWLSGYAISYYYFGYLMMANLIRISGVASSVAFNIGGALLFALTATGVFSLVLDLVAGARSQPKSEKSQNDWLDEDPTHDPPPRSDLHQTTAQSPTFFPRSLQQSWLVIALLGVVFVVLLSNYEGPLEVAHWKGLGSAGLWTWLDIADLDIPPPDLDSGPMADRLTRSGWWWWRASRVIFDYDVRDWPNRYDKTADPAPHRRENIDEFPFFSFLLGDMHPHVLALPFIMLALTVSLTLFHTGLATRWTTTPIKLAIPAIPKKQLFLFALIYGALGFLNTWDFPIQWVVAIGAYSLGRLAGQRDDSHNHELLDAPTDDSINALAWPASRLGDLRHHFRPTLALALTLGGGGLLLYAPFYVGFQSQAGGPLVHSHSSTRLAQFTVMFGPLLAILLIFLACSVLRVWKQHTRALRQGLWVGAILLVVTLGILVMTALVTWFSPSVRSLVAPGLSNEDPGTVALRYLGMRLSAPWTTLLLIAMISAASALLFTRAFSHTAQLSLLLIIAGAGMALTPDYIYLKDVFGVRINTIFKFYFQTWVLWSIAAAGTIFVLLFGQERLQTDARRLYIGVLTLIIGLGLVYPVLSISDRINEFPEAPTLDGTAYLANEQPSDYAAVQWLNDHVDGAPVILETPGGAYQYEGRISAQTGLPTLLGWAGHENQWRGNTDEQFKRTPVIEELCATTDAQRTLTLLDEYDITYVYVGPLERTKCSVNGLAKFDRLLEIVYDRDGVRIYKRWDATGSRIGE